MDYSRIPNFSPESIYRRRFQQTSGSAAIMSPQHQSVSGDYLPLQRRDDALDGEVQSSMLADLVNGGVSYAPPSSTSLEFAPINQDIYPASVYSGHGPGSYLSTHEYTNLQQHPRLFENEDFPSGVDVRGYTGYVFGPNRDPSKSPDNGMYADVALEGTFMRMEHHGSPDSNAECLPDCSYTAPQLTSPANQRAATARRKRVAKYICDMCGSKLTAKHNLTSHMNAHFGIKPFRCQFCSREYTAKSTFRRHVKTVHQDKL